MFKKDLQSRLEKIFGIKKVTFDEPSESMEQECLFINVQKSSNQAKEGRETAKVDGEIFVFAQNEKIPFGFFNKRIAQADKDLTENLFFHEFDENNKTYQNLVQRKCKFVFLYSENYNPPSGEITSVDFVGECS